MTAKDLLHKVLEYLHGWSNVNDKPATVRLVQIHAMQKAFGLAKKSGSSFIPFRLFMRGATDDHAALSYLVEGGFLNDRSQAENKIIAERVKAKIQELYPWAPEDNITRPHDIKWLYNNLFNYRRDIYAVTSPDGGMLEGFSGGLYYSFYLKSKLKSVIKENLEEIDETLWLLLDPLKRYIDKEVLIGEYNYPDVDLDSIDYEWRMENY